MPMHRWCQAASQGDPFSNISMLSPGNPPPAARACRAAGRGRAPGHGAPTRPAVREEVTRAPGGLWLLVGAVGGLDGPSGCLSNKWRRELDPQPSCWPTQETKAEQGAQSAAGSSPAHGTHHTSPRAQSHRSCGRNRQRASRGWRGSWGAMCAVLLRPAGASCSPCTLLAARTSVQPSS